ncbi:unnamed protein product [Clonostachys byssicola]|uniref:Maintenance of telomere capping protein 1 n=1 Tax=Clonostachys byssicola TaxID=160290 RepID=A0A9N9Y1B3_9HYPO|nr:unnamed protein product [Clonostachys byssicola]
MASKKPDASAADDNLDELLAGLGDSTTTKKSSTGKTKPTAASKAKAKDDDFLADLESELAAQKPPSRVHTPRLSREVASKRSAATPPSTDDKIAARKSTDSARSIKAVLTPSATSSELHESEKKAPAEQAQQQQTGGGWWGGIFSTASATASMAMKQAGAAYEEIKQNEEAKKWTDQVRGFSALDVGALRNYGDELRQRALPTFTNILHTLAPPIGSHERLLIHITHDLVGYPSMNPLTQAVFSRVMDQVEGGELLVVQRGRENGSRRLSETVAGWRDGPWWRQVDSPRELGTVVGLVEGTKLCRANAESYAQEYFAAHGGVEGARIRATEAYSESNPVRTSDLFLAIQAIAIETDKNLFAGTASEEKAKEDSAVKDQGDSEELICFAVYILDPVHEIQFSTVSQTLPSQWLDWLEAVGDEDDEKTIYESIPDDIKEIIESGGEDPREWVAAWVEDILSLSVGVVAQRYVARRMGLGEGGIGKGKKRAEEVIQEGGGEAARAGVL